MSYADKEYLKLLKEVYKYGNRKETRAGQALSLFGKSMRFDLKKGLPLLTTKKMYTKGVIIELLWFLKGDTNIKYLIDNDVHIWDDDAYRYYNELIENHNKIEHGRRIDDSKVVDLKPVSKDEFIEKVKGQDKAQFAQYNGDDFKTLYYTFGDLGPVYGKQWRQFGNKGIDQIKNLIDTLKNNPDDRRMLCIAFNPDVLDEVALPPCHVMFQLYTRELSKDERWELYYDKFREEEFPINSKGQEHITKYSESQEWYYNGQYDDELDKEDIPKRELSCNFYCRSQDLPLGTPYNIASYAILTHMIAQCVNMSVGELVYTGGDCHIYANQIEGVEEQLSHRWNKFPAPKLEINPDIKNIDDFKYSDFKIIGYQSYPKIKFPLSVDNKKQNKVWISAL